MGHIVSATGIATDPDKISAVSEWPTPRDLPQLRTFLGTVGYYRQYIHDFATVAKQLTVLTGKGIPWEWGEINQTSFEALKKALTEAPVLGYPDPNTTFILNTDTSTVGVGAYSHKSRMARSG